MNSRKIVFIVILALVIIFAIYWFYLYTLLRDVKLEELNNCEANSDCVIVAAGICGGASAINDNYVEKWQKHLVIENKKHLGIACKDTLPLSFFKAECIDGKCKAVQIES